MTLADELRQELARLGMVAAEKTLMFNLGDGKPGPQPTWAADIVAESIASLNSLITRIEALESRAEMDEAKAVQVMRSAIWSNLYHLSISEECITTIARYCFLDLAKHAHIIPKENGDEQ